MRLYLQQLFFLCQKELIALVKDPRLKFMLIFPPILQGFLFGYAANYNLEEVPYAVIDESHGALARDLVAHIDAAPAFTREATLTSPAEIADYIDSGDILLAVVVPQDFDELIERGGQASVQVIADGRNSSIAGLATGYANQIVSSWNAERTGAGGITIASRTWYNPNQETQWGFVPSLMAMISFTQVMLLAGMSIAKEREQGTFDQLLVTPLHPSQILIGKAVPPVLIGLFQAVAIFFIARFWFQIPFAGSLAAILWTLIFFMVSSTGIGLSISAISENMQQVLIYVLVSMIPMALLSGMATPVANMPQVLQAFTYIDPMRFAIDAVRRIYLEGATLFEVRWDFLPMFLIGAVTIPAAGWLFRHKTN